ncbi:energy transducer TonB [Flavobacterium oreochromis]|uniref:energy transducer TonB n=1 Tax=Flavobacterium oreochromis TaxID=2906078 RepID=UPI00385A1A19
MLFLETPEEKKSFALTSAIFIILLFLFLFFGLTYMDPPPENGIAINFGTTEMGKGEEQPENKITSSPQPKTVVSSRETQEENILNNEMSDAPVIKKTTVKKEIIEEKEEPKRPSKTTDDALSSLINGPKITGDKGSHGDDNTSGDKGDPTGSRYANSFYGSGTGVGGSGWGLKGRSLASKSRKVQDCNESGRVVVQVIVNRGGQVVLANYVKGTTNTHPCLVNPALEAAKAFKWYADQQAPERQIGFIVFNFEIGQ